MKFSCLSILPDDNADTFAAFLLKFCYSFPCLILSSTFMIAVYILFKRFRLESKRLSDEIVVSLTKKE